MLILEMDKTTLEFAPGETIHGRAGWQDMHSPSDAVLRLFWYTEGRGTQDVGVAAEQTLTVRAPAQEEPFQFTLPDAPYSFSGKLITLRWALELIVNDGRDAARVDILVSPWVKQVELGRVETEQKNRWQIKLG